MLSTVFRHKLSPWHKLSSAKIYANARHIKFTGNILCLKRYHELSPPTIDAGKVVEVMDITCDNICHQNVCI